MLHESPIHFRNFLPSITGPNSMPIFKSQKCSKCSEFHGKEKLATSIYDISHPHSEQSILIM